MPNQYEAIIEAFKAMGGSRTIGEITDWATRKYGSRWKGFGTTMADMVPVSFGGNASSLAPERLRVLQRVSRGVYRLIAETREEAQPSRTPVRPVARPKTTVGAVSYEINDAAGLLGKTAEDMREIIRRARGATHQSIVESFREAGWSTEVSLLGAYRCDVCKDGVVVEVESIDKSSVVDVLHRDLFRFLILQRMGRLRVAVLVTRLSGGEVNLEKVRKDMELFGKYYETPLMVLGVP